MGTLTFFRFPVAKGVQDVCPFCTLPPIFFIICRCTLKIIGNFQLK